MSDPVLAEAIGPIDGANVDFTTVSAYQPGTLWLYINGVLVERDGTEGVIELGGNAFRLKEPVFPGDTLHTYYQETGPTPAPFPAPPKAYQAIDLVPRGTAAIDLVPIGDSEDTSATTATPIGGGALDLRPEGCALDLVPTPLSAEEV
jgi:hypothetical protein